MIMPILLITNYTCGLKIGKYFDEGAFIIENKIHKHYSALSLTGTSKRKIPEFDVI